MSRKDSRLNTQRHVSSNLCPAAWFRVDSYFAIQHEHAFTHTYKSKSFRFFFAILHVKFDAAIGDFQLHSVGLSLQIHLELFRAAALCRIVLRFLNDTEERERHFASQRIRNVEL